MLIIGLTGSIAMGKSTAAHRFRARSIPVFDADAAVHELYGDEAVPLIEAAFPGVAPRGFIERQRLSAILMDDPGAFKRLESIIHPLVRAKEKDFLLSAKQDGAWSAVLEIPLLFETDTDKLVDYSIVVSAPAQIQRQRVLERDGMTEQKFAGLLARQLSDDAKRERADFVVETGGAIEDTNEQIDKLIESLKVLPAAAFEKYWHGASID